MPLPDFLIIGAAKSGTSTLYKYLKNYSSVYMSPKKEPAFFARDDIYSLGLEWYTSLFKDAKPSQKCGEASTDYSKCTEYPEAAIRILNTIPDVKIIYIMRHPVDRAYAHYRHIKLTRERPVESTFEKEIEKTSFCLDASNYLMQIEKYLEFFPKQAFLFLLMDNLIQNPSQVLNQIFSFLEVKEKASINVEKEIVANSSDQRLEQVVYSRITKPINKIYGIKVLKNLFPKNQRDNIYSLIRESWYGQKIVNENRVSPMKPKTREWLLESFQEHNQKLSEFLQLDLSHWDT
ncbi:MAG: sulfotransferase domain-containing protein [Crocosphaera sp.]|nr:sulfotransferase domain-containing protein [Crocosphaera sp.]